MEADLVSCGLWGQVVYEGSADGKIVEELEAVVLDCKKKRKKMVEAWAANPESGGFTDDTLGSCGYLGGIGSHSVTMEVFNVSKDRFGGYGSLDWSGEGFEVQT